jgi:hypothetical protein
MQRILNVYNKLRAVFIAFTQYLYLYQQKYASKVDYF